MAIEPIKDTVLSVMKELVSQKSQVADDDPWALLKKALTKRQLKHIKFNYFKKGILGVYVDSSSWLYSLDLEKQNLLDRLSGKTKAVIKDIRFRIGEVK